MKHAHPDTGISSKVIVGLGARGMHTTEGLLVFMIYTPLPLKLQPHSGDSTIEDVCCY